MNIKMICLGAVALSMVSGAALAGALDNPSTFSTETSMKSMSSQASMTNVAKPGTWKECSNQTIDKQHNDFCKLTMQLGGAN